MNYLQVVQEIVRTPVAQIWIGADTLWLEYRMVVACQTSRISISKVIRRAGPAWTLKKMELVVHLGLNDTHLSWRGDPLDKIPLQ